MKKLNKLTVSEAIQGLKTKSFSATDLVLACLNQIKKTDRDIKAFITVLGKQALSQAKKCDRELDKNDLIFQQKPLFGIPLAIKDNFCTKGIKTTAGSKVLEEYIPPYNATVVEKLINAGAIIIGKTNMDAWAHGSSTETSDFFTTHNPHDLSRLPGGSSGGSAAAVAANQAIAAIGSETAGSIRQPASWCGVVGLKPTYGRISRWGLIAMASSTDSPGPITKSVLDSAIILSVLAGKDPKDATTAEKKPADYLNIKSANAGKIVIGIPKEYFPPDLDSQVRQRINQAIEQMKNIGFRFKQVSLLDPQLSIAVFTILQRAEVSSNLARFDGIRFGKTREHFGEEAKKRIMLGSYVLSSGYYDQYYRKAQKVRQLIIDDFNKVFGKVDLLIAPTSPSLALKIGASKNQAMFGELQDILTEASSIAGLPGININCGWAGKLPVGVQIIGPQFSESLILKSAYQYENSV